jgi:septal ring factor EnvC (AmiA/AmiB activator)
VSDAQADEGSLRDRLSTAGEEAVGELTQNLLENPLLSQAVAAALGAGERALQAQRSAMTALNIPSGSELERLERRLRGVSDRIEDLEDRLDDLSLELGAVRKKIERLSAQDQGGVEGPDPSERS